MNDVTNAQPTPPNVDASVVIPAAVRNAAARSEELHKQVYSPELSTADQTLTLEGSAPQKEPLKEPPKEAPKDEDWKHKYQSLKPRFDRLQEDSRLMSEQVKSLQAALASAPAPAARSDISFSTTPLVTPEEETDYGKELLSVVGKKAQDQLNPIVSHMQAQIDELKGELGGVSSAVVQTAQERMFSHLDETLPNWREINKNPNFISWLGLTDPFSGAIRNQLLQAAFGRNKAHQVAAFFKGFLADEAATSPAGGATTGRGLTPPKVSLESLAAPGRANAAAHTPPAEKPIFTRADIAAFYHDVQTGKFNGRDDEKARIENAIFDAQRDNRIR